MVSVSQSAMLINVPLVKLFVMSTLTVLIWQLVSSAYVNRVSSAMARLVVMLTNVLWVHHAVRMPIVSTSALDTAVNANQVSLRSTVSAKKFAMLTNVPMVKLSVASMLSALI